MCFEPIDDICNNPCRYVSSMKKLIAKNPADPRNDLKDLLKAAQWRLEKMEAPSRALKAKHIRINMIQCCGYRTQLTSQWMIRDDSSARYDQMCGLFLVPQFFVLCFVCVLPPLPCPCLEVLMISSHRWWHQSGWCRMSKWSIWGVVIITSWQHLSSKRSKLFVWLVTMDYDFMFDEDVKTQTQRTRIFTTTVHSDQPT